ncbi:MAG: hypothetical protein R3293_25500 [Candidatus Promineifilaceae bacterium]|nr:hypothetical protein [Candidatus Promineifilaceae bacterium]
MFDEVLEIWSTNGVNAAVLFLNSQENAVATAETYHKLMKDLYWQQKNVSDMVVVAQAGIEYGLSQARHFEESEPQAAYDLRSWAKSIAYDLASFTWRGWDEPDIVITAADEAAGLRAAVLNLELAKELEKGALRISRAYWALGAQQLAAGELLEAEESFSAGEKQADSVSEESDALLCRAYAALVACLREPQNEALQANLTAVKQKLQEVEHGAYFVEQVETAARVIGNWPD